ncbi:MAG: FAD-dependent oxidoreductase [Betaproteobacteria bacterium]|nr:FAD-dependent oxidoreductase [Betaproteobacteria bacterium]
MRRRTLLAAGGAAAAVAACSPPAAAPLPPAVWVGARHERGHRLRSAATLPTAAVQRRAAVLVVGAGIAGLAAARGYLQRGVQDLHLLELEDAAGGNSRGHQLGGMACPLGAHYLPVPADDGPAREVAAWLHQIGLLKREHGRTVADERHLCHSPQERLFIDGAWVEGLLPPVDPGSPAAAQLQRFAQAVVELQRGGRGARGEPAFALPAHRSAWGPAQAELERTTFAQWLAAQGLTDERLRWYLDYCCRDDYGAGTETVSAWAGVHYFASRHGFHAPGGDGSDADDREAVFTWPEGNAWMVQRLAAPFADRLHTGRTVLRVTEGRHDVQVLAWDESRQQLEAWTAPQVVLALPLFIAARVLESPPSALREAAKGLAYAPWLVANLQLDAPLLDRVGAPPSWDNVVYGSRGLGYVDAMHQGLRPVPGATVLTVYHALPRSERAVLLADDPRPWAERVLAELRGAHPDIDRRVQRIALMRWGHAMAIPAPGVQRHPSLQALRGARGRVRYAHADLAGCSLFEEAFIAGCEAALP